MWLGCSRADRGLRGLCCEALSVRHIDSSTRHQLVTLREIDATTFNCHFLHRWRSRFELALEGPDSVWKTLCSLLLSALLREECSCSSQDGRRVGGVVRRAEAAEIYGEETPLVFNRGVQRRPKDTSHRPTNKTGEREEAREREGFKGQKEGRERREERVGSCCRVRVNAMTARREGKTWLFPPDKNVGPETEELCSSRQSATQLRCPTESIWIHGGIPSSPRRLEKHQKKKKKK